MLKRNGNGSPARKNGIPAAVIPGRPVVLRIFPQDGSPGKRNAIFGQQRPWRTLFRRLPAAPLGRHFLVGRRTFTEKSEGHRGDPAGATGFCRLHADRRIRRAGKNRAIFETKISEPSGQGERKKGVTTGNVNRTGANKQCAIPCPIVALGQHAGCGNGP